MKHIPFWIDFEVINCTKNQHKIAFVTDWGGFVWVLMPFGIKNGPPIYQKIITKGFHEHIDVLMKIFLDDFTIFNDLLTYLNKLKKCFLKCRKFDISLNLNKCAFMVISKTILGFIMFKEGKVMDPKKIKALVNMLVTITPKEIQLFNGMAQFNRCFIKNFALIMSPITKVLRKCEVLECTQKCQNVGEEIKNQYVQAPILNNPNWELEFHVHHINASQLAVGAILA
jgi:hypothetical protein